MSARWARSAAWGAPLCGGPRTRITSDARVLRRMRTIKPVCPERVLFAANVGVPQGLAPTTSFDELLVHPAMQVERSPENPRVLGPSCTRPRGTVAGRLELADPVRRFVELAKALGDGASVHSICADEYASALASVIERVARTMTP